MAAGRAAEHRRRSVRRREVNRRNQGRKSKAEAASLDGTNGYLIDELFGNPLEAVQYEVHLIVRAGSFSSRKRRTMVMAPLP